MIFYLGEFFESRLIYSERVMQPNVVEIIVVVASHLAGGGGRRSLVRHDSLGFNSGIDY